MKESPSCSRINKMDQQRVEEKNEKEEQSEESESVTDRSEEEMSDMMMHVAFEGGKESAKTYDPYFGMVIPSETEISKNLEKEARNESWAEEEEQITQLFYFG